MIRLNIIFILLTSWLFLHGQQTGLHNELNQLLASESFDFASVGLSVRDMSGKEVIEIRNKKKLIPASSQKLITTFSALDILGADYRFSTKIGYTGTIDHVGTLKGDLIIIGSGDPTFGSSRFDNNLGYVLEKIVELVKTNGIKCIDGHINIRTNVFQGQNTPASWPVGDVANYYGSGAWSLNFNENEYKLHFAAKNKQESIAKIKRVEPSIPYLTLTSEVVTKAANSGDNAYIYGDENNYHKIIRGTIPYSKKDFIIRGAIPNPPFTFGAKLSEELENNDVLNNGIVIKNNPIKKKKFNQLHSFVSPPIQDIIKEANHHSLNMYCEALLRIIAKKQTRKGSIENGLKVLEDGLAAIGIDKHSFHFEDGSGLSPRNGITPSTFTRYLVHNINKLGLDQSLALIPQTGVSGTVKNLLHRKESQKKFYLKSGSMGGVLSYTGIFCGKSGSWYSISFISNNHSRGNKAIRSKAELLFEKLYQKL